MIDTLEERWFAVHTMYKREKLVQKQLLERGINAYVPIQKLTRYYTRKIKHVELPLINCYVFVKITKKHYVPVLEVPDVYNYLRIGKELAAIPEKEIEILRRISGETTDLSNLEVRQGLCLEPGDTVEIINGRLMGIQGKLVEERGSKTVVIELDNLGYSLRMQINPAHLRIVSKNVKEAAQSTVGLFQKRAWQV
jgi:transcription antitermination factor NusG